MPAQRPAPTSAEQTGDPRGTADDPKGWDDDRGLSQAEVADRVSRGDTNAVTLPPSRPLAQILFRNSFTWLNFLLVVLGGATLATGSAPDATFLVIAVLNSTVGAVQETRAKRKLDALAVINAPRVRVVREGTVSDLPVEQLVSDDLMELVRGDQVVADAVVVGDGADLDESAVTGESEPVPKAKGDKLLSGTWVVAGSLRARVVALGAESYAGRLAAEARQFALVDSELMRAINRILRWLSVLLAVVGPILFIRQLGTQPWRLAVRASVAGLVGMIPEGLVLLTTLAFLGAAVRLSKARVLVQELPAVEVLARVDALCTDKTGTITEGGVQWGALHLPGDGPQTALPGRDTVEKALAALAGGRDANATLVTIRDQVGARPDWTVEQQVPFNSARKWSGASFSGHGTWVLGAPEMIPADDPGGLSAVVERLAAQGRRVLVVAWSVHPFRDQFLPAGLAVVAAVELRERLRPAAAETLAYFAEQGVTVRVVSGDNAATVGAIATQVGLTGSAHPVDARSWPEDPDGLRELVETNTVFGRVSPEQKRQMVDVLHDGGHIVAMTGDGVNDVLALKQADLGIAMGSGSAVARAVSQLVLLDNQFEVLPSVVAAGRQVLNNIERVATLFLVKNVYSLLLSVVIAITGWRYPFLPRHLTLVSGLAIGIPGFFLTFAPNQERFQPGFLRRVLTFSAVAGGTIALVVLLTYAGARQEGTASAAARTAAVMLTSFISLWVLLLAARPLRPWKVALVGAMAALFAGAFVTPGVNTFFELQHRPNLGLIVQILVLGAAACGLIWLAGRALERRGLAGRR